MTQRSGRPCVAESWKEAVQMYRCKAVTRVKRADGLRQRGWNLEALGSDQGSEGETRGELPYGRNPKGWGWRGEAKTAQTKADGLAME